MRRSADLHSPANSAAQESSIENLAACVAGDGCFENDRAARADQAAGVGETAAHNLEILSHINQFRAAGRPVLIGHSRKGFLQKLVDRKVDERQAGTIGVSLALAAQQTDMLRVHDVGAVRDALVAWRTITAAALEDA